MSNVERPDATDALLESAALWGWEAAQARHRAQLSAADPSSILLGHLVAGWIAVENTQVEEATARFRHVHQDPRLAGWAHVGAALLAVRIKDFAAAERMLMQAESSSAAAEDTASDTCGDTAGLIAHVRGSKALHEGDRDGAKRFLYQAIKALGPTHYAYGRVLDTLGTLYMSKDHFLIAKLLLELSLKCKERVHDLRGLALTHGQLGRLYQDWGYLTRAEYHFREDLRLAEELGDAFGEARMLGALGQVGVLAAYEGSLQGSNERARDYARRAADWLTAAVERSRRAKFDICAGFAHKDLALLHLLQGDLPTAESESARARAIFQEKQFEEGLIVVERVDGLICAAKGLWNEARDRLQLAMSYYARIKERTETARIRLDLARVALRSHEPDTLVERMLKEALSAAELSRRTSLIKEVEQELRQSLPAAYWAHLYQRVRGREIVDGATALIEGARETATVLYFDLQGSTDFAHGRDPEEVMMTINQMMHDTAQVLRRYRAQSVGSRGDGFLALVRGPDHARRAVDAGLELLAVMEEFNEPRRVLHIPQFSCRIGISSGEVLLGNVGSYDKMDYSGVGTMMNLGARIEAKAEVGMPCISQNTFQLVSKQFRFAPGSPRKIEAKGLGEQAVWDVVGRVEATPAG
ncbi:MAG: adenylate/guanylate cyclase domain-containing protein [Planctomycetia bacterium]|nr:adenylate/guanylate cyclase domain-containing protein [Planctomycetia bacterium]